MEHTHTHTCDVLEKDIKISIATIISILFQYCYQYCFCMFLSWFSLIRELFYTRLHRPDLSNSAIFHQKDFT